MERYVASRREFLGALLLGAPLLSNTARAALRCVPVATNVLGPAYRPGAPMRTQLCAADAAGTHLLMRGVVADAASCRGIAHALLDIWQVDDAGNYDMRSPAFAMRGRMQTREDGRYEFTTIIPGYYARRAKHIHYLITAPGYEPRITQCFFAGDSRLKTDPLVKQSLVIAPEHRAGAPARGVFDLTLDKAHPPGAATVRAYPDYVGRYVIASGVFLDVMQSGGNLKWHLSQPSVSRGKNEGDPLNGTFLPRGGSRFFVPEYDFDVTFVRDHERRVTHAIYGNNQLAKKLTP